MSVDWKLRLAREDDIPALEKLITLKSIELAATLPGVPFYAAFGYGSGERSEVPLTDGLSLSIVRMTKTL